MSGRLLVLGGPTAAGKTALAMAIAERWPVRLVSADAMQVYRGLNIGTGKPSPEELRRFPHDNIDVRDPNEEFSAMDLAGGADAPHPLDEDAGRRVLVDGHIPRGPGLVPARVAGEEDLAGELVGERGEGDGGGGHGGPFAGSCPHSPGCPRWPTIPRSAGLRADTPYKTRIDHTGDP